MENAKKNGMKDFKNGMTSSILSHLHNVISKLIT